MIQTVFVSFVIAGILCLIGGFLDKDTHVSIFMGFVYTIIGLIGLMVVEIIDIYSSTEIQEPCRCEVCCKHGNE